MLGPVQLVAVLAGANAFVGVYDVVADFASDAVAEAALATAAATTASGSALGAVTAANAAAAASASALDVNTGGWTLDPILNQLVIYGTDNVTVIATFNCFDSSGTPSVANVYRRVRI